MQTIYRFLECSRLEILNMAVALGMPQYINDVQDF